MSQATRSLVAYHPHVIADELQRADLLDPTKTNTNVIEGLRILCVLRGHIVQITALNSDHHDDSELNPDDPRHTGTHRGGVNPDGSLTGGFAFDGWFNKSTKRGDYMDASDPHFQAGLRDGAALPSLHQIGLAGEACTDENYAACAAVVFTDSGADHVHFGFT